MRLRSLFMPLRHCDLDCYNPCSSFSLVNCNIKGINGLEVELQRDVINRWVNRRQRCNTPRECQDGCRRNRVISPNFRPLDAILLMTICLTVNPTTGRLFLKSSKARYHSAPRNILSSACRRRNAAVPCFASPHEYTRPSLR